jgi:hypothetical protein
MPKTAILPSSLLGNSISINDVVHQMGDVIGYHFFILKTLLIACIGVAFLIYFFMYFKLLILAYLKMYLAELLFQKRRKSIKLFGQIYPNKNMNIEV